MHFDSLLAIWQMNGHGPFVWSAYFICLVVLVSLIWAPLARKRRLLRELRVAEQRRRQRAQSAPGL